jgi:aryl-alcohol dehydrogenase-like predicted oxidoreductase
MRASRGIATPAKIALAWLLAQKPWIVPIPETTTLSRLEENIAATSLELSPSDLSDINQAISKIPVGSSSGADRTTVAEISR